ncbi:hypothetical protein KUCAC02_031381 [Chaenocephalus aceratus]|nr:hypothetical protein KUCAC02_031381 [Chaenocephalus aceratus]
MYGVSGAQQQGFQVFRGSTFTISCSIQPQYPGGSFQLNFTSINSANNYYSEPAVNHSAHFLFPAAEPAHQGSYSCVYHVSAFPQDSSSESRLLSVTVTGVPSDPEPFIIRAVVLPLTLLLVTVGLYFYCKLLVVGVFIAASSAADFLCEVKLFSARTEAVMELIVRRGSGSSVNGFTSTGIDEEAVLDQGNTSSTLYTNFEKEELESHRAVYVGVHVPLGRESRRRHRHRGHRHHRKRRDRSDGQESPSNDTPSQRVQFILGTEDGDEEHIPHDMFTELDEITFRDGDFQEWKETARWLKFEEDVEAGGERWSKPYVATLSLHSLFELRSCIMHGTVLLDMRAGGIEEIADMVIDSMLGVGSERRKLSNRIPLVRSSPSIGKKHSDTHLLERNGNLDSKNSESRLNGGNSRENSTDFSRVDTSFMKKIPRGAEASNVLVARWTSCRGPSSPSSGSRPPCCSAASRSEFLSPQVPLPAARPVWKRSAVVHEIGRSIATLMTDEIFHDVAYKAKDRTDLLSGIDEFLDHIRIEPPKSVPSQEKRKLPSAQNGSAHNCDIIKESEHEAGPELQRTGRWLRGFGERRPQEDPVPVERRAGRRQPAVRRLRPLPVLRLHVARHRLRGAAGGGHQGETSAIESLFGASMTGVAYSLFAGQPLTILGSTGPVLVFEKILFTFCR